MISCNLGSVIFLESFTHMIKKWKVGSERRMVV